MEKPLFSLSVRSHFMIAHSFRGEIFGPAQKLHGATYVVDVEFRRKALDQDNLVIDIGLASKTLDAVLAELNYKNLDDIEAFRGLNTTTEYLAYYIFAQLAQAIAQGTLGETAKSIDSMRVSLSESHVASAAYQAPL